jgi:hypothetical protein
MNEPNAKQFQYTTIRLPCGRHKELRHVALDRGISMGKIVEQAIDAWLRENGNVAISEKEKMA